MAVTYEPIAYAVTPSIGTAAFSFTSIPSTYTDLKVVLYPSGGSSDTYFGITFNNTGAVTTYSYTTIYNANTTVAGRQQSNQSNVTIGRSSRSLSASYRSFITFDIFNYANTNINKSFTWSSYCNTNGGTINGVESGVGYWRSTTAIDTITFTANTGETFNPTSQAVLYGIKKA